MKNSVLALVALLLAAALPALAGQKRSLRASGQSNWFYQEATAMRGAESACRDELREQCPSSIGYVSEMKIDRTYFCGTKVEGETTFHQCSVTCTGTCNVRD